MLSITGTYYVNPTNAIFDTDPNAVHKTAVKTDTDWNVSLIPSCGI